jgi:SAM-dependent methyltransferase
MPTAPPVLFDQSLLRKRLARAARREVFAGFLRDRAADDVCDRLLTILRHFSVAVEIGCRDRALARALQSGEAGRSISTLIEMDCIAEFVRPAGPLALVGDLERLPLATESVDLVVSLLALHWTNDLVGALIQIRRILRPDGLFIGALFTGATLTELRQSLLQAEDEVTGGASPRVSPFADGPDLTGLAQRAGLALPVVDIDRVTVRYDHPLRLLADLRAMGETSVLRDHARRPLRRDVLARACALYAERFSDPDGRIRATFEISTLTGWAPHPDQQQPMRPGSAKARLADALGVPEQRLPPSGDPDS